MRVDNQSLLDCLVNEGILSEAAKENLLAENLTHQELEEKVLKQRLATKDDFLRIKCDLVDCSGYIDLTAIDVDPEIAQILPVSMCRRHCMICIYKKDQVLTVAMANPMDIFAIDDLRLRTGLKIDPLLAVKEDIEKAIKVAYKGENWQDIFDQASDVATPESIDEIFEDDAVIDAPVVRLVDNILHESVAQGASDIHIEPFQKEVRVRYRVDGRLQEVMSPPKNIYNAMISRIKIMSDLDIAERRIPQDGRLKIQTDGRQLDLRVSTLPTMCGESVVMRLLDSNSIKLTLGDLGFSDAILEEFKQAVSQPNGIVLVTGPTGSGKSTTLYAAMSTLNSPHVKIVTVEDPVEYYLRGINQVQCRPKAGLTFAAALRSFLRQDPDIILVGEIRDQETGEIAIEAALTGHLVMSTLHTNSAVGTITRLVDMGIEPFLIASSLNAVLAQRLVRTICPSCKEPAESTEDLDHEFERLKIPSSDITLMHGKGCKACFNSGYKGRVGIYELMTADRQVQKMITNQAKAYEIQDYLSGKGFLTLRDNGILKITQGVTTYEEVLRVTSG